MATLRRSRERSAAAQVSGVHADKLARLQTITDAALSQLGVEDLLTELLARTRDLLGVDTAAVFLLDTSGTELVATAASGLEEEIRQAVRVPVGAGLAGRIAASGQPLIIDRVDETTVASPVLISSGITAMLGVPMIRTGVIVGVLQVGASTPRAFTADDIELLQLVADRASTVVQDRTARLDRAAALALQRSLLPDHPPGFPGLDVATRYIPGGAVGVGGDWYDLFPLPGGHIGVTIGDVAGSGLRAAVVMGRIRSALRAYALETLDPADVLTRLDRKIQMFEPDAMATVIYAVLDPDRGGMMVSNAGHPRPVLTAPGRRNALAEMPIDVPVGAFAHAQRHQSHAPLAPGGAIFFYTDGLVERRGRPVTEGIARLCDVLSGETAERLCVAATTELLANTEAFDDIALLAIRRT